MKTFVTGLEREDIEALALALYKIPKTVDKLAERITLGHQHLEGMDFMRQIEIMEQATDVVLDMVKQLRDMRHLEKIRELNDQAAISRRRGGQIDDGPAEGTLQRALRCAAKAMVIRDLYELMEKAIDRCRDAGNVVMHIVLKNS